MIWGEKKVLRVGDQKTRNRFAWIPLKLTDGRWIWMELCNEIYEYSTIETWFGGYAWVLIGRTPL